MIGRILIGNFDKIASETRTKETLGVLWYGFLAVVAGKIRVRVVSSKFGITEQMYVEFAGLDRI